MTRSRLDDSSREVRGWLNEVVALPRFREVGEEFWPFWLEERLGGIAVLRTVHDPELPPQLVRTYVLNVLYTPPPQADKQHPQLHVESFRLSRFGKLLAKNETNVAPTTGQTLGKICDISPAIDPSVERQPESYEVVSSILSQSIHDQAPPAVEALLQQAVNQT